MGLIPDFQLVVNGDDRTTFLRSRLLTLRLSTETEAKADEVELVFDDGDNVLALPKHGVTVDLAIGYADGLLHRCGRFTVDTSEPSGGDGDKITVKAKGADVRASLKSHKHRAHRATNLGSIMGALAKDNGLQAVVHPDLAGIAIAHVDQTGESDLHFATRLGRRYDAVATFKGGKLIFVPRGIAASASGKVLPPMILTRADLKDWKGVSADRPKAGKVRAAHRDTNASVLRYVTAGSDEPSITLRHVHANAAVATAAAHAHHRRQKRKGDHIDLTLAVGAPDAMAGRPLTVSGLRDGLNGSWITSKVEQELDFGSDGFSTKLEATVDGRSTSGDDGTPGYGGDDSDQGDTDDGGGA